MYQYNAEIFNVIDGDTVDALVDLGFNLFTKVRLRLLGINTPEKFGETKTQGLRSKDYTKKRLLNKNVVIEVKDHDVFGRWLAIVTIDGVNFNQELLEKGYAEVYERP